MNLGFESCYSRVAAQLVIRWEDQSPHYDDKKNVLDIVTLDIASAGGLRITEKHEMEMHGSDVWKGYTALSLKHQGFGGNV